MTTSLAQGRLASSGSIALGDRTAGRAAAGRCIAAQYTIKFSIMTEQNEWHGMPAEELEARRGDMPPAPKRESALNFAEQTFATVRLTGNFGLGCGRYQAREAHNITQTAAHQLAWSLFGACGHQITYYDRNGNVVGQE